MRHRHNNSYFLESLSMQLYIEETLIKQFKPLYLSVVNESSNHSVAEGSETHFKVVLASDYFEGMSAVKRHQAVYAALTQALATGVHALALHTYTGKEWSDKKVAPDSPACMGGSRVDGL
jgi:BolA protein